MLGRPYGAYIGHLEPVDLSMYCVTGVEMVKIEFYMQYVVQEDQSERCSQIHDVNTLLNGF